MSKTIIAGTDFTASSVNACKYAAFLAQKIKCKLTIFNLFDSPIIHSNIGLYGIDYTTDRRTSEGKTIKLVLAIQKEFPDLKIDHFITSGSFKRELKEFTDHHLVEAVVMGLQAKNRISKFIYGSHGLNVAGKIDAPVIIVPENYKSHNLSNVLLAVDNEEKLRKSPLIGFVRFVKVAKSKLSLLHVRTEVELFPPQNTALKISEKRFPVNVIKAKDMEAGIKKYCADNKIDLVAVISKRHSVFYNLFTESNTKKVTFASKVPVMSIHE